MNEIILNIYLIIENGFVTGFKAKAYEKEGEDNSKIAFLKSRVITDFETSYHFDAPISRTGKWMKYNSFAKLEKQGMHFQLFEDIFSKFSVPENPLICVTPVVDGEIYSN
ncbi:MAG: hypothetical protein K8F36_09720 [Melioribacteraceae bacterium]|nr:hypothetical protein [Melioribacteraceae bacterium]MCO6474562.1 hypothetical protein [Melioribacteraceae bacterium]MDD3558149.1 hypothetical protein [Melioribacteraceae bacterium]